MCVGLCLCVDGCMCVGVLYVYVRGYVLLCGWMCMCVAKHLGKRENVREHLRACVCECLPASVFVCVCVSDYILIHFLHFLDYICYIKLG